MSSVVGPLELVLAYPTSGPFHDIHPTSGPVTTGIKMLSYKFTIFSQFIVMS